MRHLLVCLVLASVFLPGVATAQDLFDGARPLKDTEAGLVLDSLRALSGLADCLEGEELRKHLRVISEEKLALALKEGRIQVQTQAKMGGKEGATRNRGSDHRTARVLIREDLFTLVRRCLGPFITLLDTLFHEGVHMNQNFARKPSFWFSQVPSLLGWKIERVRNEALAARLEARLKVQLAPLFDKMIRNLEERRGVMEGVPACMGFWKGCSLDELRGLRTAALAEGASASLKVEYLGSQTQRSVPILTETLEGRDPEQVRADIERELRLQGLKPTALLVKAYFQARVYKGEYFFREQGDDCRFVVDSFGGTVGNMVPPGILFPQDAILVRDRSGIPWLIVCGFNHLANPSGNVIAMPANPEVLFPGEEGRVRLVGFSFSNHRHRVIASIGPVLSHPTSIVTLPAGRLAVWDPGRKGLFDLLDTNGDGLPDRVDPRNKLRLPEGKHFELDELAWATWTGKAIRIEMRLLVGPAKTSDSEAIYARDIDGDGFFETWDQISPSQLPTAAPVILGQPAEGAVALDVYGVASHRVEVRARLRDEAREIERVVGRGAIPAEGWGRIRLTEPVASGQLFRVVDLTNGVTSGERATASTIASVSRMAPEILSTRNPTEVTLHGYRLEEATEVSVGGVVVPFRLLGERLVCTVPARPPWTTHLVVLTLRDGTRLPGPYELFSYRD